MPKFSFPTLPFLQAKDKDASQNSEEHVRMLVVNSDVPAKYQGRVATALIDGDVEVENGNVSVTVEADS